MIRVSMVWLLMLITGCATPPVERAWPAPDPPPYLLHLPGIGGERRVDRRMAWGLIDAGFPGNVEIYNWVREPGIMSLTDRQRHEIEAERVAAKILAVRRASPRRAIILTGHSGG